MSRLGVACVLLLLAACGPASPRPGSSPAATAAFPAPTSTPAATSTPTATPTSSTCRLPVVLAQGYLDAAAQKPPGVGFVTIPGGAVTVADQTARLALYSWAVQKWVPNDVMNGRPSFLSPDGTAYAYTETRDFDPAQAFFNTRIHVVDLRTNADSVVLGTGHYSIRGWDASGILLFQPVQGGEKAGGFRLDPASGAVSQFTTRSFWSYASGSAWAGIVNPADPNAFEGPGSANTLLRIDPRTGAEETWLYRPGERMQVLGGVAPAGVLIVSEDHGGLAHILALPAAGPGQELWSGPPNPHAGDYGFNSSLPDRDRTWLLGPVTPTGSDLFVLSQGRVTPVGVQVSRLAGPCRP